MARSRKWAGLDGTAVRRCHYRQVIIGAAWAGLDGTCPEVGGSGRHGGQTVLLPTGDYRGGVGGSGRHGGQTVLLSTGDYRGGSGGRRGPDWGQVPAV